MDTSSNGAGGGPVDLPSTPFVLQYQAGLLIDNIVVNINGANLVIAAPSLLPDDAGPGTQPASYTVQATARLGANANWQQVGDTISGDDLMHVIQVPVTNSIEFFRMSADYPTY